MRPLRRFWNALHSDRQATAQIAGITIGAGDLLYSWVTGKHPDVQVLVFAGTLLFLGPTAARNQGRRNGRRGNGGE